MTTTILLLGADGQVGQELRRALAPLGTVLAHGRATADLGDLRALTALLELQRPNIIVNAAAYTAVDKAETERDLAQRINTDAPALLAAWAVAHGAWLVHYSTDYVFDGASAAPYDENDLPGALNVYGATKLAGEEAITASGCRHLTFRTSWVYAAHGKNFLKTILTAATQRNSLQVVDDQHGAPTGADLIADVTALCLYRLQHDAALADSASGLYHLTARGETSWYGYARFALDEAKALGWPLLAQGDAVTSVPSSHYPTPARRPAHSTLATDKLQRTFGLSLPDWRDGVARTIAKLPRRA